jgi:hypothetical protein
LGSVARVAKRASQECTATGAVMSLRASAAQLVALGCSCKLLKATCPAILRKFPPSAVQHLPWGFISNISQRSWSTATWSPVATRVQVGSPKEDWHRRWVFTELAALRETSPAKVVGRVIKLGAPHSEFEVLGSQLLNQLTPNRAGRIHSHRSHRASGRDSLGGLTRGSPRVDLRGWSRFRISHGWVSLKARNSELACLAHSCQKEWRVEIGWSLPSWALPS